MTSVAESDPSSTQLTSNGSFTDFSNQFGYALPIENFNRMYGYGVENTTGDLFNEQGSIPDDEIPLSDVPLDTDFNIIDSSQSECECLDRSFGQNSTAASISSILSAQYYSTDPSIINAIVSKAIEDLERSTQSRQNSVSSIVSNDESDSQNRQSTLQPFRNANRLDPGSGSAETADFDPYSFYSFLNPNWSATNGFQNVLRTIDGICVWSSDSESENGLQDSTDFSSYPRPAR